MYFRFFATAFCRVIVFIKAVAFCKSGELLDVLALVKIGARRRTFLASYRVQRGLPFTSARWLGMGLPCAPP